MCRWLAYSGTPVLIEQLLYEGHHSLIDQSLHSQLGAETTNGDGFGLGWYGDGDEAGVFHSVEPAWNDRNLRELAAHVRSPLVFAHIRASSGTPVQQTNCHPFRHGRFLWMHNGLIHDFHRDQARSRLRGRPGALPGDRGLDRLRDAVLPRADASASRTIRRRPSRARSASSRRSAGAHGIEHPFQGTIATTDGDRLWAFRYSSEGATRSLFYSTNVEVLRALYPDNPRLTGSATSRGSSSPSRSATCPVSGTRSPRRATA